MKRDRKMTIRFDGAESAANSRKAAGEDVRMNPHLRVLPDMRSEDGLEKSEPAPDQVRTHNRPTHDDIQVLEQLIRQENGTIAQRDSYPHDAIKGEQDRILPSGPSVWTFPEPIKQTKAKNVETERKLNSAANRIEDAGMSTQHAASSVMKDEEREERLSRTGRIAVVHPADTDSSLLPISAEDKPYSIPDWDLGSLESGHSSGRFGIRPAIADYSRTRSRGPSWLKVFASVAGAIATGALFGYLALALFAGQGPWSGRSDGEGTAASTAVADPAIAPAGSTDSSGNPPLPAANGSGNGGTAAAGTQEDNKLPAATNGATANVQVDLKAQSFQALQYGVFSSAEGADATVADLADKGLAAYRLDTENDFRVYVGMSGSRDGALALSQLLDGMEVYVKAIELPAVKAMPFSGDADVLRKYWKETSELIGMLDRLTLDQLELTAPKPFSAETSASWRKLHEQWLSTSAAVASKLTGEQEKKASNQLAQSINTAAVSLAEYDKKPSASHLWNAQSALMSAVFAEKGWLESSGGL